MYLSNSALMVPSGRGMLALPNNSSILLSNPRCIEKLGKTDNHLSIYDLHGVVGAVPRKATREVLLKGCLL